MVPSCPILPLPQLYARSSPLPFHIPEDVRDIALSISRRNLNLHPPHPHPFHSLPEHCLCHPTRCLRSELIRHHPKSEELQDPECHRKFILQTFIQFSQALNRAPSSASRRGLVRHVNEWGVGSPNVGSVARVGVRENVGLRAVRSTAANSGLLEIPGRDTRNDKMSFCRLSPVYLFLCFYRHHYIRTPQNYSVSWFGHGRPRRSTGDQTASWVLREGLPSSDKKTDLRTREANRKI